MSIGDLHERVYGVVELARVADRRLVPAAHVPPFGGVPVAPVLAGEQAAGERAPDEDGALLVEGERHELVFGVPRFEGVVDLLTNVPLQPEPLGDAESLHKLPA